MIRRMLTLALLALVVGVLPPLRADAASDGYWDYRPLSVNGSYRPLVGAFGGDKTSDILWYGPGTRPDSLWLGRVGQRGSAGFVKRSLTIGGAYLPVVGDFAGEGHDDILWYTPGNGGDYLWTNTGDGHFTSTPLPMGGSFHPYRLVDYTSGKDDIFWYDVSTLAYSTNKLWHFDDAGSGAVESSDPTGASKGRPVVGDWDGNGYEDVFIHIPGVQSDEALFADVNGLTSSRSYTVNGSYEPTVVYDVPRDGILFWADGAAAEAYWRGTSAKTFTNVKVPAVDGIGTATTWPLGAAIVSGSQVYDGMFIGTATTGTWYDLAPKGHEKGNEQLLVGDWDGNDTSDLLWYATGTNADELWYLEPSSAGAAAARLGRRPA